MYCCGCSVKSNISSIYFSFIVWLRQFLKSGTTDTTFWDFLNIVHLYNGGTHARSIRKRPSRTSKKRERDLPKWSSCSYFTSNSRSCTYDDRLLISPRRFLYDHHHPHSIVCRCSIRGGQVKYNSDFFFWKKFFCFF